MALALVVFDAGAVPVDSLELQNPRLKQVWQQVLSVVVKGRENFVDISIVSQQPPTLLIKSYAAFQGQKLILGEYKVSLSENEFSGESRDRVALELEGREQMRRQVTVVKGKLVFGPSDLKPENVANSQNLFRTLLRADAQLHPQIQPLGDGGSFTLSVPQQNVFNRLSQLEANSKLAAKPLRALVLMPTGLGKSVLAIKWIEKEWLENQGRGRVVFILQNSAVLKDIGAKFASSLRLDPRKDVFVQPNVEKSDVRPLNEMSARVLMMTRSFAFAHMKEIEALMQKHGEPVYFVLDEAHHLGRNVENAVVRTLEDRERGQFQQLLKSIDVHVRADDQILGLTATPWHKESDILSRVFDNQLLTSFLSPEEVAQFLKHHDYINMARLATLRAMAEGYLSPVDSYDQIDYLDGNIRAVDFLNKSALKISKLVTEEEQARELLSQITVHEPFLETLMNEISKKTNLPGYGSLTFIRGIIFVPSIAHANVYAELLTRKAKLRRSNAFFKPYHSKLDRERAENTLDWIQDGINEQDMRHHKYLLVVDSLGEGFDVPAINHVVTARTYNGDDAIGMRELLQQLGRGTRASYAKTKLMVTDFSGGAMHRLLFDNLAPVVREDVAVKNELVKTKVVGPAVLLDKKSLVVDKFDQKDVDVTHALKNSLTATRATEDEKTRVRIQSDEEWLLTKPADDDRLKAFRLGELPLSTFAALPRLKGTTSEVLKKLDSMGFENLQQLIQTYPNVWMDFSQRTAEELQRLPSQHRPRFIGRHWRLHDLADPKLETIVSQKDFSSDVLADELVKHRQFKREIDWQFREHVAILDGLSRDEVAALISFLRLVYPKLNDLGSYSSDHTAYSSLQVTRSFGVDTKFPRVEPNLRILKTQTVGDLNFLPFVRDMYRKVYDSNTKLREFLRNDVSGKNLVAQLPLHREIPGLMGKTTVRASEALSRALSGHFDNTNLEELYRMPLANWPYIFGSRSQMNEVRVRMAAYQRDTGQTSLADFHEYIRKENIKALYLKALANPHPAIQSLFERYARPSLDAATLLTILYFSNSKRLEDSVLGDVDYTMASIVRHTYEILLQRLEIFRLRFPPEIEGPKKPDCDRYLRSSILI